MGRTEGLMIATRTVPSPSTNSDPALGSGDLSELTLQVQDLRQRVSNLEERLVATVAAAPKAPIAVPPPPASLAVPPDAVAVLGRMLVAIAGAYILRALTDWGVLPAGAGVAIGLVYALVWLWVAARSPVEARFAAALSCSTSVLIMAPLVWEATNRFKVMPSGASSAVLAAFALVAIALGSRAQHRIIGTIAGVSSIVLAIALLLARDDIVPFAVALLVIAAAVEFAAWRGLQPGARAFAAVATDFSILLFSYLMSRPHGMPETWVPVAPHTALTLQLALALIYLGTAVGQSVVRRRTLASAEIVQTGTALLIGLGGAVWVFKEDRAVMLALRIAALVGGLAFYAVSFLLFERENKRNFRALSTFGLLLVLAGIYLPFSRSEFWMLSCACAVACCSTARVFALPTLGLHGAVYLFFGSAAASATSLPLPVFFAIGAGPPEWLVSITVLLAAAVSWVAITGTPAGASGLWRNQITSLALAAHVVWITAGLAVYGILTVWRAAGGKNSIVPADTVGTVVLTGLSLALAWAGTHWRKQELVWLLYGVMALGGYKLVVRDFINEHNLALVISLLCYGSALIVLPRMLHMKSRAQDA
jgi:hypothetical protein